MALRLGIIVTSTSLVYWVHRIGALKLYNSDRSYCDGPRDCRYCDE